MRTQRPILGCVLVLTTITISAGCGGSQAFNEQSEVPDVITAKEFRLVDAHDKTRISLCMMHGMPSVILYAEDGKRPTVLIGSDGQTSTVSLLGESGEAYVSMSIEHQEYRGVALRDDEGNSWVGMGLSSDKEPAIWIGDSLKKDGIHLGMEDAGPFIKIEDKEKKITWNAP